jgi:hypothetical protein
MAMVAILTIVMQLLTLIVLEPLQQDPFVPQTTRISSHGLVHAIGHQSFRRDDDDDEEEEDPDRTTRHQILTNIRKTIHCNNTTTPVPTQYFHSLWNLLDPEPILSQAQAKWILDTLSFTRTKQLLVFGAGYDSTLWHDLNPCGRTVFLEDSTEWMRMLQHRFFETQLELYPVRYQQRHNTSLATAWHFFRHPYIMTMPSVLQQNTCFDIILLDAPMGYEPDHPGRMEAAYWCLKMVHRCHDNNTPIYIFVHDAQREVEAYIVEQLFVKQGGAVDLGQQLGRRAEENLNLLRLVRFDTNTTKYKTIDD